MFLLVLNTEQHLVQKNVQDGFSINMGYTNGTSKDVKSVGSSQARSQMRYNPISNNPNDPPLTTSDYEIKNRIFVSLAYTHEFFKNAPTTISLFYNGQSGQTYSFIYYGDINNDGFDQNDLFYIPKNNSDILLGTLSDPANHNGSYIQDPSMYGALNSFINNNEYLKTHRGQIAGRNVDRLPWNTYVDLHITQDIPIIMSH